MCNRLSKTLLFGLLAGHLFVDLLNRGLPHNFLDRCFIVNLPSCLLPIKLLDRHLLINPMDRRHLLLNLDRCLCPPPPTKVAVAPREHAQPHHPSGVWIDTRSYHQPETSGTSLALRTLVVSFGYVPRLSRGNIWRA